MKKKYKQLNDYKLNPKAEIMLIKFLIKDYKHFKQLQKTIPLSCIEDGIFGEIK